MKPETVDRALGSAVPDDMGAWSRDVGVTRCGQARRTAVLERGVTLRGRAGRWEGLGPWNWEVQRWGGSGHADSSGKVARSEGP